MPFFSSFTGSFSVGRRKPISIGVGGGDSFSGDISAATYSSISFDTTAQEQYPDGITFNNNGSKMYIIGPTLDEVYEYSLSTNFDVSSATYTNNKLGYNSQDTRMRDLHFNNDGTKLFLLGDFNTAGSLYQYNLTTPYDLSTASYASISKLLTGFTYNPKGFDFSADGLVLWTIGSAEIVEYSLSSAYDISTISPTGNTLNIFSTTTSAYDGTFVDNGSKFLLLSNGNPSADQDKVRQYSMTTPYDLSTITYDSLDLFIGTQAPLATGIEVSNDETKMIIIDSADAGAMIFEYNIGGSGGGGGGGAVSWSGSFPVTATANTFVYDNAILAQDASAEDFVADAFMHPDNNIIFLLGNTRNLIYQVDLSSASDISTASYTGTNFDMTSETTTPNAITFSGDGTKMYIYSQKLNTLPGLFEYDLSTAWDITTATLNQSNTSLNDADYSYSIQFNDDGTKIYTASAITETIVYEFSLSSAYDISTINSTATATFDYSTIAEITDPTSLRSMRISSDGTKIYFHISSQDKIHECTLGTAWDLSTISYSATADVNATDSVPYVLFFNSDGSEMYTINFVTDTIYQYTMS